MNLSPSKSLLILRALALVVAATFLAAESNSAPGTLRASPEDATLDSRALEVQYLQANAAAMTKMMRDMAPHPSGDVDRDFVAQMIPHHQGAIDMSLALLRAGHNEKLKRLAQEIIITQQDEIAAMCLAIRDQGDVSFDRQSQAGPSKMASCVHN